MAERNLAAVADRISRLLRGTALLWRGDASATQLISSLEAVIANIRPLCLGAKKKRNESDETKSFFERLEIALYRTEDIMEKVLAEGLRGQRRNMAEKVGNFLSPSNPYFYRRKMKSARRKITEIANKRPGPKEHNPGEEIGAVTTTLEISEEVIIGRDVDREAITARLLNDDLEENVLVIPVVGIGGVGKTLLIRDIFDDREVQRHFDLQIWVSLTEVFELRVIMEKIVKGMSMKTKNPENIAFDELEILLCRNIQGKKFLLVLDDVQDEDIDNWLRLKRSLSFGANGSKIVITTHSEKVAEITGGTQRYELKALDEDKALSLLMKVAFKQGDQPTDPEIMKIGKEIVKLCGRLPLAICVIGRFLFHRNQIITAWQSVSDELLNLADLFGPLGVIYDNLSSPLRDCFAYCGGLFPKGYEFDVQTLVTLWMSQGFIEPKSSKSLEDVGYDYVLELVSGSFFQGIKKDAWGNITKCKIHNLMHDLARFKAGNACATLHRGEKIFDRSLRHLSFDFRLETSWKIPNSLAKLKRIRSLILPKRFQWAIRGSSSGSICDGFIKFEFLRTLDLHNMGIKVLPPSIGELEHLRYLDLSQNVYIKALPDIGMLQNLQTLKLNHCDNLSTLPGGITKLVNLRHLENESRCSSLTHMPRGLGRLTNLRTLSEFVLSKGTGSVSKQAGKLDELKGLNDLRGTLKIQKLRSPEVDKTAEAHLYEKPYLQCLILFWDIDAAINCERSLEDLRPHQNLRELYLSAYVGDNFSSWLPSQKNLVKLSLSGCTKCKCLPPLDHFTSLEVLVLDELKELKHISEKKSKKESNTHLPSLKELRLSNLPNLERWWTDVTEDIEETTFPCLSRLIIEDCLRLTSMPLFPCLEELELKNTSWKPFQRTIAAETRIPRTSESEASSSTSPTVASLSKLKNLRIIHMPNGEPNMWQRLPSLQCLTFDDLDDINALLEGLQQVTSLQQLYILGCASFTEIPSWISELNLKKISIELCPNLKIPSDRISLITSLPLEIDGCPPVSHIESIIKDRIRDNLRNLII